MKVTEGDNVRKHIKKLKDIKSRYYRYANNMTDIHSFLVAALKNDVQYSIVQCILYSTVQYSTVQVRNELT